MAAKKPKSETVKVEVIVEEQPAQPVIVTPAIPDPFNPAGKTIDERMADLLEEHKQMGAR